MLAVIADLGIHKHAIGQSTVLTVQAVMSLSITTAHILIDNAFDRYCGLW